MVTCPVCMGDGIAISFWKMIRKDGSHRVPCPACAGEGKVTLEVAREIGRRRWEQSLAEMDDE